MHFSAAAAEVSKPPEKEKKRDPFWPTGHPKVVVYDVDILCDTMLRWASENELKSIETAIKTAQEKPYSEILIIRSRLKSKSQKSNVKWIYRWLLQVTSRRKHNPFPVIVPHPLDPDIEKNLRRSLAYYLPPGADDTSPAIIAVSQHICHTTNSETICEIIKVLNKQVTEPSEPPVFIKNLFATFKHNCDSFLRLADYLELPLDDKDLNKFDKKINRKDTLKKRVKKFVEGYLASRLKQDALAVPEAEKMTSSERLKILNDMFVDESIKETTVKEANSQFAYTQKHCHVLKLNATRNEPIMYGLSYLQDDDDNISNYESGSAAGADLYADSSAVVEESKYKICLRNLPPSVNEACLAKNLAGFGGVTKIQMFSTENIEQGDFVDGTTDKRRKPAKQDKNKQEVEVNTYPNWPFPRNPVRIVNKKQYRQEKKAQMLENTKDLPQYLLDNAMDCKPDDNDDDDDDGGGNISRVGSESDGDDDSIHCVEEPQYEGNLTHLRWSSEKDGIFMKHNLPKYRHQRATARKTDKSRLLRNMVNPQHAFVWLKDHETHRKFFSDEMQIFGLCCRGQLAKIDDAVHCNVLYVEMLYTLDIEDVKTMLRTLLPGKDIDLHPGDSEYRKPLFLRIEFDTHEDAWDAYTRILNAMAGKVDKGGDWRQNLHHILDKKVGSRAYQLSAKDPHLPARVFWFATPEYKAAGEIFEQMEHMTEANAIKNASTYDLLSSSDDMSAGQETHHARNDDLEYSEGEQVYSPPSDDSMSQYGLERENNGWVDSSSNISISSSHSSTRPYDGDDDDDIDLFAAPSIARPQTQAVDDLASLFGEDDDDDVALYSTAAVGNKSKGSSKKAALQDLASLIGNDEENSDVDDDIDLFADTSKATVNSISGKAAMQDLASMFGDFDDDVDLLAKPVERAAEGGVKSLSAIEDFASVFGSDLDYGAAFTETMGAKTKKVKPSSASGSRKGKKRDSSVILDMDFSYAVSDAGPTSPTRLRVKDLHSSSPS